LKSPAVERYLVWRRPKSRYKHWRLAKSPGLLDGGVFVKCGFHLRARSKQLAGNLALQLAMDEIVALGEVVSLFTLQRLFQSGDCL
jgi:hypothetical protein